MIDRDAEPGAGRDRLRQYRCLGIHPNSHRRTQEAEPSVLLQRAGQQTGFAEHLEPVADAEHRSTLLGERGHRLHDRGEAGEGAGPQVVAVGEPAWQNQRVESGHGGDPVPEEVGRAAQSPYGQHGIVLAVRAGEDDDTDPRWH